jgi:hypothetical protein
MPFDTECKILQTGLVPFRSSVCEFCFLFACTSIAPSDKIKNKRLNHLAYINFICMFVGVEQHLKSVACRQAS